jgi:hypothetical protein
MHPDAWYIATKGIYTEVTAIEVINQNPMNEEEIQNYIWLWETLDPMCVDFYLEVHDCLGGVPREVNLCALWYQATRSARGRGRGNRNGCRNDRPQCATCVVKVAGRTPF